MYDVYIMRRKQIYLTEDHARRLRELAAARGVSEAALIREALDTFLPAKFMKRPQLKSMKDHPMWKLMGIASSPDAPVDGAENHDHYLYGAPKSVV